MKPGVWPLRAGEDGGQPDGTWFGVDATRSRLCNRPVEALGLMDEKGSVGLVKARAVREGFKVPHVAPTKCCIENNPPNHFHSTVASEQEAATIQKSSRGREKDVRHRVDAVAK